MNDICRKKKQLLAFLAVVTVGIIMLAGAIVWILSLEGMVTGLWASIMSVIFTFLGVLYALLQWLAQLGEQQVIAKGGDFASTSSSLLQGQSYYQVEHLTSHDACLPAPEIPSSSMPLSSVIDSPLPVALRTACPMNEDEQNSPLLQRGVSIHIHIYHEK